MTLLAHSNSIFAKSNSPLDTAPSSRAATAARSPTTVACTCQGRNRQHEEESLWLPLLLPVLHHTSSLTLRGRVKTKTPSFNPLSLKTTAFPSAPCSLPFSITESDFSSSTQPLVKGHQALAHGSSLTALGKCSVTTSSTDNWPPSWKRSLICSYGSEAFVHISHQSPQHAFLGTCPAYWCPFLWILPHPWL